MTAVTASGRLAVRRRIAPGLAMAADLVLDLTASGQTVALAAGQTLELRLAENPTTGYRWSVHASGGLQALGDAHVPGGPLPGAAGERRLRWCSPGEATHELLLLHQREWEPADRAIGRFALTVIAN